MISKVDSITSKCLRDDSQESGLAQMKAIGKNLPTDGASRQKLYVAAQDLVNALKLPVDRTRHILDIVFTCRSSHLKLFADRLNSHWKSQYLASQTV